MAKKPLKIIPLENRLMLDASLAGIVGQVLWLDAADTSTIIDADGDNASTGTGGNNDSFSGFVAQWLDKSGNNDQTGFGTEAPAYAITTQNGNNVITFDGINDQITGTATATGAELTIFAVYQKTGVSPGGRGDVIDLGQNSPQRTTMGVYNGSDPTAITVGGGSGANFNDYSGTYSDNTYYLNTLIHNGANFTGFINGNNVLNSTAGTRQTSTDIHIGNDSTGGNNFNGNIAEIIVYERELTSDERHDVETYLAGKWGLTTTNIAPIIATNTGTTLDQGTATTITNAMLASTDLDNSNSNLIYTITNTVDFGTLTNTNTSSSLGLNDTFRQSDIDNGYVTFTHNNSATVLDAFSFTVTDNEAITTATTFNFSITPTVLTGLNAIPNPVFHYDAQDLDGDGDTSDQPSDGTSVGTVVNPIGTTQNATQGGGGQQPTYEEDVFDFGKGGIVFDGIDDHLDITNNTLINDTGPWDEKSFAFAFRTGADVVTNQVIYEQGGASNGYNLGIWNGELIAYVWAESYWGGGDQYKSINLGTVTANTTYSVIMIHDATGATLNDRTFAANVNGGAFTTLTRVDAQGSHIGNIVLGRGDDTHNPLDDSDFSDAGNFDGAIGEAWNWNHALDAAQITEVENHMRTKWFGSVQTLDTNNALSVNEGGSVIITNANLDTNDAESPDTSITYTVTSLSTTGTIELSGVALGINDTFTQDDINNNRVTFDQNGTDISSDTFNFSVSDGFNDGTSGTFTFNVVNVNDAPTLSDGTLSIGQGGTVILTTTVITGTDVDNADNGLIYEITSNASDGVISLNGIALGLNDTFTQQNVIDGIVTYTHNTIATADDNFNIAVTDGALTSASQTVTVTIDLSRLTLSNANTTEGGDINIDNGNLEYTQPIAGWYDTDWQYRRDIIVDHTQVDGDLTDYNLLITDDGLTADFWTNVQSDGGDIVVTDAAGNKLDRELVSIDTIGQTLQLYVRTDLSSTVDTQFYIYYGNATATETNDATTWNNNFTGVWHFDDDFSDGNVADSSQQNNDAFTRGGFNNSNLATGVVGGAGQFNNGEYLSLNYAYNGNNSLPEISVSAWINTTDTAGGLSDNWAILDFDRSEFFNVYIQNGTIGFSTSDNGSINDQNGGTGLNDGNWHHITAVYDGTDKILYANGVEVDRIINVHGGDDLGRGTRFGFIGDGSEAAGFDGARNNVYYDGQFDNIRLYEGTLNAEWVAAEYRNQSNPSSFYSVGVETSQPNNITYTITSNTNNGTLYIDTNTNGILDSGEAIGMGNTFTQADIDNNLLRYNHNGGETTSDTFLFTVNNGVLTTGANTMNISITPVNDAPTNIGLSNNNVSDIESIGTVIGNLSSSDADLPGDTFIYSIQSDPDGKFIIFGNELRLNNALSFSVSDAHNVTIRTDDGNGGLLDQTFTINVTRQSNGVNILPDRIHVEDNNNRPDNKNDSVNDGLNPLISNFMSGTRSGELQAFYGEFGLGQILLENVTMPLQSSMADINSVLNNAVNIPLVMGTNLEIQNTVNNDVEPPSHYTRMIDFLKMTSNFSDDEISNDVDDDGQNPYNNFINDDNIANQFDDIKNYNDQRQARLMDALSRH